MSIWGEGVTSIPFFIPLVKSSEKKTFKSSHVVMNLSENKKSKKRKMNELLKNSMVFINIKYSKS